MNETAFNKVFYGGYLDTYAPALMPAYAPIYNVINKEITKQIEDSELNYAEITKDELGILTQSNKTSQIQILL